MSLVAEAMPSVMIYSQENGSSSKGASLNYADLSSFTCGVAKTPT